MEPLMLQNLLAAGIPLVAPLLTTGVKKLLPKIPGAYLPIVCLLMGVGLDFLASWLSGMTTPPWFGAALGAAGVAVREGVDQIKKGNTAPATATTPHVS